MDKFPDISLGHYQKLFAGAKSWFQKEKFDVSYPSLPPLTFFISSVKHLSINISDGGQN